MAAAFQIAPDGIRIRSDFISPLHRQLTGEQYDAEFFEWQALRAALKAARETFTIVELGAGYGRWSVVGLIEARALGLKGLAISVEAEPEHFKMMQQHFVDNGLDPNAHRLIEAAATWADREVYFVVGHAKDWYGQAILPSPDCGYGDWPEAKVTTVRGLSLTSIIGDTPTIDLLHMDVQGEEAAILRPCQRLLNKRVKRAYVATHNQEVHIDLRRMFTALGWQCCHDFSPGSEADTEYGRIRFVDGVQSWVNPKFLTWRKNAYFSVVTAICKSGFRTKR